MKKIPSLFMRNYDSDRLVINEVVKGSEWVVEGEGVATRKFDGTCCMIKDGLFYKRYDAKQGKTPPEDFIPAQEPDSVTKHWPGWIRVSETDPVDKYFREARSLYANMNDGTYELCGEKVNANPEKVLGHILIKHGEIILDAPRTFEELKKWFATQDIEGIVWHNPDGRMVKIKKKDFGLKRNYMEAENEPSKT